VASAAKSRERLGWEPRLDLQAMVDTTIRWRREHPRGYDA
jgi:UDP-glucose 4-epimerase